MLFIKIGYHPIAGLTMAYASAVGGFAANIVVGMQDALVYSFTITSNTYRFRFY
ncbi:AbgT family transporter [Staphylococcus aureus]